MTATTATAQGTPVQSLTTVRPGDTVQYWGTRPGHHGRVFTVTAVHHGRTRTFDLAPADGGQPLYRVHWSSLNILTA